MGVFCLSFRADESHRSEALLKAIHHYVKPVGADRSKKDKKAAMKKVKEEEERESSKEEISFEEDEELTL